MKIYAKIDENNYVTDISLQNVVEGLTEYETDIENFDFEKTKAYKLEKGKIVLDQEKAKEVEEDIVIQNECKIAQYGLNSTDYIMDRCVESLLDCTTLVQFLKVFADIKKQYSEKIAQRKEWRKYLEEHKQ